jgi:hypothetical protein
MVTLTKTFIRDKPEILSGPCNRIIKEWGLIRQIDPESRRECSSPHSFCYQQYTSFQQRKKEAKKEILLLLILFDEIFIKLLLQI